MVTDAARTPVLVGVAAVTQREDDPSRAREPVELMIAALEGAAADAGARALLARADSIRAPRGFWDYPDPCRIIAQRFGASAARTEVAEVGILQTSLFGRAAQDIAGGRADVVLITGGEAHYRSLRASLTGQEAPLTRQAGVEPDSVLRPAQDIIDQLEIQHGLVTAVSHYAMIENALRAAEGRSIDGHRRELAELEAQMSRVAAANPDAWNRNAVDAEMVMRAPMLAFPYTKLHVSQWNVDQAAGLILCSVETASALGVPRERWIFPLAVAESNYMLPLTRRRLLHRSPGFALAGARVLQRIGRRVADVNHLDLYSCFPAAVRVQMRELGIAPDRSPTVCGGMVFAGGPLNNFVLQSQVKMAQVLRADPGSVGLVTAISGMITKQGVTAWSTLPPEDGFFFDDVSIDAAAQTESVELRPEASGPATILTYTVVYQRGTPERAIVLCQLEDGRRTLADSREPELMNALMQEEYCGRAARIAAGHVEVI
jgi:acetyl-CoA C-acetyltransferase